VAEALKFLPKAFGFRKYGVQMRRPDGKINHAVMKLGNDLMMMGYPGPKYKNPKKLGKTMQSLYINADDVERHFQPFTEAPWSEKFDPCKSTSPPLCTIDRSSCSPAALKGSCESCVCASAISPIRSPREEDGLEHDAIQAPSSSTPRLPFSCLFSLLPSQPVGPSFSDLMHAMMAK
jgi:hypothetical protein